MPTLMIRNVDEAVRREVAVSAARAGRSMQEELLQLVNSHYARRRQPLVAMLLEAAGDDDSDDFCVPDRQLARDFSFE